MPLTDLSIHAHFVPVVDIEGNIHCVSIDERGVSHFIFGSDSTFLSEPIILGEKGVLGVGAPVRRRDILQAEKNAGYNHRLTRILSMD